MTGSHTYRTNVSLLVDVRTLATSDRRCRILAPWGGIEPPKTRLTVEAITTLVTTELLFSFQIILESSNFLINQD
jgi:hypothetical protein